ncbi:unnamed protein product [Ceratitis capitata]|uniref:(Mediterranean fruit fly) hypothetical protein n=1 Tax=Ceratitis capitata TaxID=7213 RepID=A0A811UPQ5_CERCA|nr:unnamed protein product [Ceratitis capitata]
MKDLGAASLILGMRIPQNVKEGTLRINHSSNIGDVVLRLGTDQGNPIIPERTTQPRATQQRPTKPRSVQPGESTSKQRSKKGAPSSQQNDDCRPKASPSGPH